MSIPQFKYTKSATDWFRETFLDGKVEPAVIEFILDSLDDGEIAEHYQNDLEKLGYYAQRHVCPKCGLPFFLDDPDDPDSGDYLIEEEADDYDLAPGGTYCRACLDKYRKEG